MPLADRDYMRNPSPVQNKRPTPRRPWGGSSPGGFWYNPVWVIILLNFLFFIVTSISRNAFYNLGLIPADFLQRPWTLLTSMFVHARFSDNPWHIFGNMITLYFFGTFFIRLVGQGRFLLVYFIGGIAGGILYLLIAVFTPLAESISILVGASGAVFALAGAMVVMVPKLRVALWGIVPMPLWVLVLVFFIIWPFLFSPGAGLTVAWQAHLGGIIAGAIAGYFLKKQLRLYYYR